MLKNISIFLGNVSAFQKVNFVYATMFPEVSNRRNIDKNKWKSKMLGLNTFVDLELGKPSFEQNVFGQVCFYFRLLHNIRF